LPVMAEAVGEKDVGQGPEGDGGGQGADENTQTEETGGVSFAEINGGDAEDGGKNRDPADDEGIAEGGRIGFSVSTKDREESDEDATDQTDGVGFKNVGGHARAIPDIVSDIVGDGGGVTGVVLFEFGFNFSDEVGSDIRSFGVNSSTEPGKHADERGSEGEAGQAVDRGAEAKVLGGEHVKDTDRKQGKSHHQKPCDRASVEGVPKSSGPANGRGLGRPNIRHDGDPHSAKSGEKAACGTDQEANSRGQVFKIANCSKKEESDAGDGLELAV